MKYEIRQHGKKILCSECECSMKIIFNNLTQKNFKGKEYYDYIRYVAFRDMGFDYGTIEYVEGGVVKNTGTIKKANL